LLLYQRISAFFPISPLIYHGRKRITTSAVEAKSVLRSVVKFSLTVER
jgi:hypothetical protein